MVWWESVDLKQSNVGSGSMIGLIQRVLWAKVDISGETVAAIGPGLLVLIGVRPSDDAGRARRLLDRLLQYRVFADDRRRMNLSLVDTGGGLLLVPQFTLAADTGSGLRPGFSGAAAPELAGDAQLKRGECALETEMGHTPVSLDAHLKEIEQGFLDLLEQRPHVQ